MKKGPLNFSLCSSLEVTHITSAPNSLARISSCINGRKENYHALTSLSGEGCV